MIKPKKNLLGLIINVSRTEIALVLIVMNLLNVRLLVLRTFSKENKSTFIKK